MGEKTGADNLARFVSEERPATAERQTKTVCRGTATSEPALAEVSYNGAARCAGMVAVGCGLSREILADAVPAGVGGGILGGDGDGGFAVGAHFDFGDLAGF